MLKGKFLHILEYRGFIDKQAEIINEDPNGILVQYFSWDTNKETTQEYISKGKLPPHKLYADKNVWRAKGDEHIKQLKNINQPVTKKTGKLKAWSDLTFEDDFKINL